MGGSIGAAFQLRVILLPLLAGLSLTAVAEEVQLDDGKLLPLEQLAPGPVVLPAGERAAEPLFAGGWLWLGPPRSWQQRLSGEPAGPAAWDPQSLCWYAPVAGTLVRLEPTGRMVVVADDFLARDFDFRAQDGLLVSRERNDTIVLRRLQTGQRTVLATGGGYFHPRFSPDASQVLLSESHPDGGKVHLIDIASGTRRELGRGYGATWDSSGRRILFSRISHDGYRILGSDLYLWELASGRERQLTATGDLTELEPVISPDGRWLLFLDGTGGIPHLVPWDEARGEVVQ